MLKSTHLLSSRNLVAGSAVVAAVLLMSPPVEAETFRLTPLDARGGAVRQQAAPTGEKAAPSEMMQGTLHYSAASGLTLDATPVRLMATTTLYPMTELSASDTWKLDGLQATLFGVRSGRGVRADLVIVQPQTSSNDEIQLSTQDRQWLVPNPENSNLGEMKENAPN